jgi:siroheme synthase-like protein
MTTNWICAPFGKVICQPPKILHTVIDIFHSDQHKEYRTSCVLCFLRARLRLFEGIVCVQKENKYRFFPILLDLQKFPCLVVGGGKVALRKVQALLKFNAEVTVVSPKLSRELIALSAGGKIIAINKPYSRKFISRNKLVFSATDDPKTNRMVSEDCKRKGILLNVADNPELCDFILSANLMRGSLIVSVSSQGKAPFLSKEIKGRLAKVLPPSTADVAELATIFRNRLLSNGNRLSRTAKRKKYKKFLAMDWEQILTTSGKKKSYQYLERILKEKNGG